MSYFCFIYVNSRFSGNNFSKSVFLPLLMNVVLNILICITLRADVNSDGLLELSELTTYISTKIKEHLTLALKENFFMFTAIDLKPRNGKFWYPLLWPVNIVESILKKKMRSNLYLYSVCFAFNLISWIFSFSLSLLDKKEKTYIRVLQKVNKLIAVTLMCIYRPIMIL